MFSFQGELLVTEDTKTASESIADTHPDFNYFQSGSTCIDLPIPPPAVQLTEEQDGDGVVIARTFEVDLSYCKQDALHANIGDEVEVSANHGYSARVFQKFNGVSTTSFLNTATVTLSTDTPGVELVLLNGEGGNQSPTANAGPDQTVEATSPSGASVVLNGNGSSDPDGDPLTFGWSGTFGTASGATPEVTLGLGAHTITLTVNDPNGASDTDEVVVTVEDTTPPVMTTAPELLCGTTQTLNAGDPLGFSVEASDGDVGEVTLGVAGLPAGATVTPSLPASGDPVSTDFSWTPTNDQTGTHVVTFTATDEAGLEPNHKFKKIMIGGVSAPDGDPADITVTAIMQDEPVNGHGDGNTCPDGKGVGSPSPRLRAERSGQGDGRVYHVSFVAVDGQGGECEGTVTVCVPHDMGHGGDDSDSGSDGGSGNHIGPACIDQGPLFDSTGPCDGKDGGDSDSDSDSHSKGKGKKKTKGQSNKKTSKKSGSS